jgi:hypothetical protein
MNSFFSKYFFAAIEFWIAAYKTEQAFVQKFVYSSFFTTAV